MNGVSADIDGGGGSGRRRALPPPGEAAVDERRWSRASRPGGCSRGMGREGSTRVAALGVGDDELVEALQEPDDGSAVPSRPGAVHTNQYRRSPTSIASDVGRAAFQAASDVAQGQAGPPGEVPLGGPVRGGAGGDSYRTVSRRQRGRARSNPADGGTRSSTRGSRSAGASPQSPAAQHGLGARRAEAGAAAAARLGVDAGLSSALAELGAGQRAAVGDRGDEGAVASGQDPAGSPGRATARRGGHRAADRSGRGGPGATGRAGPDARSDEGRGCGGTPPRRTRRAARDREAREPPRRASDHDAGSWSSAWTAAEPGAPPPRVRRPAGGSNPGPTRRWLRHRQRRRADSSSMHRSDGSSAASSAGSWGGRTRPDASARRTLLR